MKVILIIDTFGINKEDAVLITRINQIPEIREKIRWCLSNNQTGIFKIRINEALYKRLKDFEGTKNLEIKRVLPSVQLSKNLGEKPPEWMTDKIIVDFELFNLTNLNEDTCEVDEIHEKILFLIEPKLLNLSNVNEFYTVVKELPDSFLDFLHVDEIFQLLSNILKKKEDFKAVDILFNELKNSKSVTQTLTMIGEEQILEKGRKFVLDNKIINISFPPRQFQTSLLSDLSIIKISEDQANIALCKFLEILKNVDTLIKNDGISSQVLAKIVVPWPSLLNEFSSLIDENPKLATTQLKEVLGDFDDIPSINLFKKISDLIKKGRCESLKSSATINEVLSWSRKYLHYTQYCFSNNEEPDESVSDSFTKWFLKERVRIQRSNSDWCIVSNTVKDCLKQKDLVVLCIIDALSAIHIDAIKKEIETNIEGAVVSDQLIFAPVPTLTEIGKLAIATGQNSESLPNNKGQDLILKEHYSKFLKDMDSIQITQSWKEFRNSINEKTNLLICIENRIDERLHKCTDFSRHQKDVESILKSLVKDINDWIIRAAQLHRKIKIIITADHGVSCINKRQSIEGIESASISERVCRMTNPPEKLPNNTTFIKNASNKSGYLVPTNRIRLVGSTPLVHGGLTAEEILIPFITVTKGPKTIPQHQLIKLGIADIECQVSNYGWQVKLNIETSLTKITNLYISADKPFKGREGPIGPLYPNKKTDMIFILNCDIEQFGLVVVPFTVKYFGENESESRLDIPLTLRLQQKLIEKDEKTKAFDDMFD